MCVHRGEISSLLGGPVVFPELDPLRRKTEWLEHWQVQNEQLVLQETFVKGSGAGIDPAPSAVLDNGWYRWKPAQPLMVPSISLANSELTPDNWTLCALDAVTRTTGQCIDFAKFEDKGVQSFAIKPCP